MPGVIQISPRKIHKEDLATTTTRGETAVENVMGLGSTTLTKVDAIFLSDLTAAADDAAAATAGVGVGYLYFNTTTSLPKVRMA